MKLKNTTDFPDYMLRRMVSWCCRQYRMPINRLRLVEFTRTRKAYQGRAWCNGRRILVRIGSETHTQLKVTYTCDGDPVELVWDDFGIDRWRQFLKAGEIHLGGCHYRLHRERIESPRYPINAKYPGRVNAPTILLADRLEALLHVTAHEITHHVRWADGIFNNREARVDGMTLPLMAAFRANREQLLAEWNKPPKARECKPQPARRARNEAAARVKLAEWERKLKLAKTKVAGYRRKVRRYDRIAAAPTPGERT